VLSDVPAESQCSDPFVPCRKVPGDTPGAIVTRIVDEEDLVLDIA
jgi:hypothetical protein